MTMTMSNFQQIYLPPVEQGYGRQQQPFQQQRQQEPLSRRSDIEPENDAIDTYGSIIKDLTDTDKIMEAFELRLRGKKKALNGQIVDDPSGTAYIKDDKAARDFVNIVRSIVNRHTDFSFYDEKEAYGVIDGASTIIPEWLMMAGETVPKDYRIKIGFEAMSYIKASCHKAMNGRMLTWTKGAISEQNSLTPQQPKKSIWDWITPGRKKQQYGY